jgi:RimJ/RimL family protein N-acetyltransferase
MQNLTSMILSGHYVTLVPLQTEHHDDLVEAVQDGQLWHLWFTFTPHPNSMKEEIDRRLQLQSNGQMLPFTIIDRLTLKPIGMTSFYDIDQKNKRLAIGGTWLRKSLQGTAVNTEMKCLMLEYAFETLGCIAVEFRTHFINHQSRRAIEKLGAKLDGILRSHMIMPDSSLRDTCVYSIISCEWPMVKQHLGFTLAQSFSKKTDATHE